MMTYTECNKCMVGHHEECLGTTSHDIICICSFCNAIEFFKRLVKQDLSNEDGRQYLKDMVKYHYDLMRPSQQELFNKFRKQYLSSVLEEP